MATNNVLPVMSSSSKLNRISATTLSGNPRATLHSWLKFKPTVDAALTVYPKPYVFTPAHLSANSVSTKIRDAIRGCLAFAYETPAYIENLSSWYSEIVVKAVGRTVVLARPSKTLSTIEVEGDRVGSTNGLSFPSLSLAEVNAFALLLNSSKINGPIIVRNPPDISTLESLPNVEILTPEDGSLILL